MFMKIVGTWIDLIVEKITDNFLVSVTKYLIESIMGELESLSTSKNLVSEGVLNLTVAI